MIYHGLAMTGLFITSILVFVIQTHLLKLIGLAPLAVIVVVAFIWIQVTQIIKRKQSNIDIRVLGQENTPIVSGDGIWGGNDG